MTSNIIYYHSPCTDGIASMFVATRKLKDYSLFPFSHGNIIETNHENKNIYFLDMAPPRNIYDELIKRNKVIILDHHVSNMKEYTYKLENVYFNMDKSGVGMAWEFFMKDETKMPDFLKMIQDRDLWKFQIEKTKEFCEGFYLASTSCESLEEVLKLYEELLDNPDKIKKYIDMGKILLKQKMIKVNYLKDKLIEKTYIYKGHKVCMANTDGDIVSDLGNALSLDERCDFAILWRYDHISEKYNVSMRSSDKVDVSIICKEFGGGGHKNAAGCSTNEHPIKVFNDVEKINKLIQTTL